MRRGPSSAAACISGTFIPGGQKRLVRTSSLTFGSWNAANPVLVAIGQSMIALTGTPTRPTECPASVHLGAVDRTWLIKLSRWSKSRTVGYSLDGSCRYGLECGI